MYLWCQKIVGLKGGIKQKFLEKSYKKINALNLHASFQYNNPKNVVVELRSLSNKKINFDNTQT